MQQNQQQFVDTLGQMKKQTKAQTDSALAERDAIEAAQARAELDERAWIVVAGYGPPPERNQVWPFVVEIINTGKTPARNVRFTCLLQTAKNEASLRWVFEKQLKVGLIAPNEGQGCSPDETLTPERTNKMLDAVQIGHPIFSTGYATYSDVSGHGHWLTFCATLMPSGRQWEECRKGNDTGDGKVPPPPF